MMMDCNPMHPNQFDLRWFSQKNDSGSPLPVEVGKQNQNICSPQDITPSARFRHAYSIVHHHCLCECKVKHSFCRLKIWRILLRSHFFMLNIRTDQQSLRCELCRCVCQQTNRTRDNSQIRDFITANRTYNIWLNTHGQSFLLLASFYVLSAMCFHFLNLLSLVSNILLRKMSFKRWSQL